LLIGKYEKEYIDNGTLKKIESFTPDGLQSIVYYKDAIETDTAIIQQLTNAAPNSFTIIAKTITPTNYIVENSANYDADGTLLIKHRSLFESTGELLCIQTLFPSGDPVVQYTKKYYYNDGIVEGNSVLEAYYKADGTLDYIDYDPYHEYDSDRYGSSNINELRDRLAFTQSKMDYYLTADFMPLG
jgi:hypothetical protein